MNLRVASAAAALALVFSSPGATANPDGGLTAFAANCFSPHLTADKALAMVDDGIRVEFYDYNPFSAPGPSALFSRTRTPGTDRRCEVAFDGRHGERAAEVAVEALKAEGILTAADLPSTHRSADVKGTTLLAARFLNPKRIAVVHTGERPGPNGTETFLTVERLTPEASANE